MYWLMTCRHRRELLHLRERHREHVASGGGGLARVLIGSALTDDDGETPVGNFGVLDAPSREAAQAFAENDPFARAGIVESIDIVALPTRFPAHRIGPMTG